MKIEAYYNTENKQCFSFDGIELTTSWFKKNDFNAIEFVEGKSFSDISLKVRK